MSGISEAPVALVTGATRGTGREIALALANEGHDVAVLGRTVDQLDSLAAEIAAMGRRVLTLPADIMDADAIDIAMARLLDWSGDRISVLVNVAGIPGPLSPPIGQIALAEFDAVIATNLRGPFLTMSRLLPVMYRQRSGRVVNIGGNHGMRGRAGRASYSASKWALRGLTRSAALEAGPYGVTVNYVAPGPIAVARMRAGWAARAQAEGVEEQVVIDRYVADMGIAMGRPNEPADVVAMVLFLIGEGARNITGQELVVDGGVIV